MQLNLWIAVVAASIVLLAIPGPTILTVISYSISYGYRANIPLVAGVALGDSTALAWSLIGLGALLATSGFWFAAVKWIGGVYLLYLGIRLLRAGVVPLNLVVPERPGSLWRLFINTYLVTALNPKGIVFFVVFLPQFLNPAADTKPQLWLLGATFIILAAINATLYALFATTIRNLLQLPRAQRIFNLIGGSLICGAGIWVLLARRQFSN